MVNRLMFFLVTVLLSFNLCGCFALLAGVAGGAGTAVWLSGKLEQQFNSPYEPTIAASKKALDILHYPLVKETQEDQVTQLISTYTDGSEIWIDIRKVTEGSTKVEVRVGAVGSNKQAAAFLMKTIEENL